MKKYDLHLHTNCSKCSTDNPAKLLKRAKKKGLNGIAITDHNQIRGALKVADLNTDPEFEVIIGEEVMTDQGEILVYYVKEKIKPGKYEDVIREVRKQGAVCSVAHPFTGGGRVGIDPDFFRKLPRKLLPDAIETFNGRPLSNEANKKAKKLAEELGLAQTGGSDGHFFLETGVGHTSFHGKLIDALKNKKTSVSGKAKWPSLHRSLSRFVKFLKRVLKRVF